MEYRVMKVAELKPFPVRDIRANVVSKLTERIQEGYNPARPLSVVRNNGNYIVADGNHRLKVLQELGIEEVPCLIRDGDPYKVAVECNADEDTYAPMDLFDWLDVIGRLRGEGLTQAEIGERIGWTREQVKHYIAVLNTIGTEVLNLARGHQEGRVPENGTTVPTTTFTEGWFRNSGFYDLQPEYQLRLMTWFVDDQKCKPALKMVQKQAEYLKGIQEQVALVEKELAVGLDKTELLAAVNRGEYTTRRLQEVINRLNEGAKNKALFGVDALEELRKLPDNSVDVVITDPPYGIDFVPTRKTQNPSFQDEPETVFEYLEEVFAELKRVCKANAHIYVFSGYTNAFVFREMLAKCFWVQENWLTWVKNNHTMCDFKKEYASKYEVIWFCKMPHGDERHLNNPCSPDVLEYAIPQNKYHDCQKPIELLQYLIENSSGKGEVILDPFAGSGSTLIAAAKCGRYYIGFELEKSYEPPFKRFLGDVVP